MSMQEAFAVLQLASQHDAFGRYSEASFLYMMSVDMLNAAAANQPDEKKAIIEKKAEQYKSRAQYLSTIKPPAAVEIPQNETKQENSTKKQTSDVRRSSSTLSNEESNTPSSNSVANAKQRAKNAMIQVKSAKELQKLGGLNMKKALKQYEEAIKTITEVIESNVLPEFNENLKKTLVFIRNSTAHLRLHLHAKTKFQEESYRCYMKADSLVQQAIALDEVQKVPEAIRVFGEAAIYFKRCYDAEVDSLAKQISMKRMNLCHKRVEQLTMLQKEKVIPGMRQVQGEVYVEEEAAPPKNILSVLSEKIKNVVSSAPTEGVVGIMMDEHPDTKGEWITEVKIDDTKTMQNPVDSSLNYTVYIMTVRTKIMRDGVIIDTPSWQVIRRYHQFKVFNSKLKSMNIPDIPDFPPNRSDAMAPQVIKERIVGFTKYFQSMISRAPNPELNQVSLRFLRNTFKREEANQE